MKNLIITWDEYKQTISEFAKSATNLIFRGQQNSEWDLETSFTRENRKRYPNKYTFEQYLMLVLYLNHKYISSITKEDLNVKDNFAILNYLSFLQQHGFPTPLLDWTESPYIAAYFAFKDMLPVMDDVTHVRIFAFDNTAWHSPLGGYEMIYEMPPTKQHLTVFSPSSKYNPRLIHQQGIHTISNVDNINEYIIQCEKKSDKKFLYTYDISIKERPHIMKELHLMGISEMILFPGVDGTCEYLRQRHFGDWIPFNNQDIDNMLKELDELKRSSNKT